ncbi:MAG: M57 family metalloprotease [Chitinophagaceae bacterium]
MRKILSRIPVAILAISLLATACQKQSKVSTPDEISPSVLNRIAELGFSTDGVVKHNGGYLVEGDIYFTPEQLTQGVIDGKELVYANEEHYRTTNLVTGTPRNITVSLSSGAAAYFSTALDTALGRYNNLGLNLTFTHVASGGNINIVLFYQVSNVLGSSGFPTSAGNPYGTIQMNTYWYSASTNIKYLASIIAHEMGHCIGFRHTDYMNRSYSCGGSAVNEGSAGVGAIWISGTPTGASAGSWMLSCSNGSDRPFTTADKTALTTVY